MRRRGESGFGIIETLLTMLLVGIILGIVGRGYQTLSRLNLATYQMSQRMELSSFLQRLSYEVSGAITLTASDNSITFTRVDPTLNLQREEAANSRLPWPIPAEATTSDLFAPTFLIQSIYYFSPETQEINRRAFDQTETIAVNIGEFTTSLESDGRILSVQIRPGEMTSPVSTRIFLPVVRI